MEYLEELGKRAREASRLQEKLSQGQKNQGLMAAAQMLLQEEAFLIQENEKDLQKALESGVKASLLDRLKLTKERIQGMAKGLEQIAALEDPIGEVISMKKRPNGLVIGERRVPMGVVGIIYESRPNVTADAFGLCFKTGNSVVLKGGSDALCSNQAIVRAIRASLRQQGLPEDSLQLVERADRETTRQLMRLSQHIDLLIPRGGAGLIQAVVENSSIPVIETGTGNCHIYVDEFADIPMAVQIIVNAKTQRLGVCNACESLVVHENILNEALPAIAEALMEKGVEIRGDQMAAQACPQIARAEEEDFGAEYLDAIISVKTVGSLDEAVRHINQYNTGHSEAIVTKDYGNAQRFLDEVDAAAVYVNASTRFTDGFEFGFGAEIGISTQKLHARGPMGLKALTTSKYIIYGNGQIRE